MIAKWREWITRDIHDDVLRMHMQRDVWLEAAEIIAANEDLPESYWWQFMRDMYGTTQAVAVRRQADTDWRAGSLGKLIEEIGQNAELVRRASYVELWEPEPHWQRKAEEVWTERFGGGDSLTPAVAEADLRELKDAAQRVKRYVDQHIAHNDAAPKPGSDDVSLKDVHDAIDMIGTLFQRYYNLLTASSISLRVALQHRWQRVFMVPWMTPPDRPDREKPFG